jgi:hypothetical protein
MRARIGVRCHLLPDVGRSAGLISVCLEGRHLLGSRLQASVIGTLEGYVSAIDGDMSGRAWFPHDPHCITPANRHRTC